VNRRKPVCNWEYTGEADYKAGGYLKKAELKTDCGKTVWWTRDNRIGMLFKQYGLQCVPQGKDFYVTCPYCGKVLNIYNPFDDGETWRIENA